MRSAPIPDLSPVVSTPSLNVKKEVEKSIAKLPPLEQLQLLHTLTKEVKETAKKHISEQYAKIAELERETNSVLTDIKSI